MTFTRAEEERLSALADYYDEISAHEAIEANLIVVNKKYKAIVDAAQAILEKSLGTEEGYLECGAPLTQNLQKAFKDAGIDIVYQRGTVWE